MSKLFIMVGCPGAGKSTWIKENIKQNQVVVSRDNVRNSLLKEGDGWFSKEEESYQLFIRQIDAALATGFDVYADATHLTIKARRKLINSLCINPQSINAIYIKKDLETCIRQNAGRTGKEYVPENQLLRMFYSIQEPLEIEGFDEITIIGA